MKSLHRRAARRDSSEGPIVDALEARGFSVQPISAKDVPDLLIGRDNITRVAEVKTGTKALRPGQVRWWGNWRGGAAIVLRDVEDVARLDRAWSSLR